MLLLYTRFLLLIMVLELILNGQIYVQIAFKCEMIYSGIEDYAGHLSGVTRSRKRQAIADRLQRNAQGEKEGRYMGSAPLGYKNTRDEKNKPIIAPGVNARFIKQAFEEMATGNFTQEEIQRRLRSKGFTSSKNGLNKLLRNPVLPTIICAWIQR